MNKTFKRVHPTLQKNRWFSTIWVALPKESNIYIKRYLEQIVPYCEWVSTFSNNPSRDTPHITLRYLGFSDELSFENTKKDSHLFRKAIQDVSDIEIELKDINIWKRKQNGKVVVARLNWEITKKEPFIKLHKELLKIPNYYLFDSLEQENYTPHISLGAIDLSDEKNLDIVDSYLQTTKFETIKFKLNDFGLNLTSPEHTEVIAL